MSRYISLIGVGQLGSLFAEAALRLGEIVVPVLRDQKLEGRCQGAPELCIVGVGEESVEAVLNRVPDDWLQRVVLIQNELRTLTWAGRYRQRREQPTIAIIWFERKNGQRPKVVLPSVLYGEGAEQLGKLFEQLGLPFRIESNEVELHREMALKNLYILGLNFAGLRGVERAGQLLQNSEFEPLIDELIELEQRCLASSGASTILQPHTLKVDLRRAIEADPEHGCAGRSAPIRLKRTLQLAERIGYPLPLCNEIATKTTKDEQK